MVTWAEQAFSPEDRATWMGPGAPFELALEDVLGAKMEVFVQRPPHLRQVLVSAAQRFGDQEYLVFPERTYTFTSVVPPSMVLARLRSMPFTS
jgi:hypothetical protein